MPDILDQAGLSDPKGPSHLTATPQSTVSAQEMVGPMRQLADAMGFVGQKIDEWSVPYAQRAGQQEAAVSRAPDGSIDVSSKMLPLATGAGAAAYNAALAQGSAAAGQTAVAGHVADISSKRLGDPAGFSKDLAAYVTTLKGTGDPMLRPLLVQEAERVGQQHLAHIAQTTATATLQNQRTAMVTRVQDLTNQLYGMATGQGQATPEAKKVAGDLTDAFHALGDNPLYGYSKDQIEADLTRIHKEAAGWEMVGKADRAWANGGDAAVEKVKKEILDDPDSTISTSERQRVASGVDARLQYLRGYKREQVATALETTNGILEAWHDKKPVDNEMVDAHLNKLKTLGASEQVAALEIRRLYAPYVTLGVSGSSDAAINTANGGSPPGSAVTAAIGAAATKYSLDPALLTRMAKIESRFDPNADNGTAKGLFQFIPDTWKAFGAGGNVFDPAANADAAARLLVANRNTLRAGLGRDPTSGEIYLAHQQGAGSANGNGALGLLTRPNEPAVNVVGKRALLGNGGTLDMTAAQFAQLWTRKFDTAGAGPISASNSGPVDRMPTPGSLAGTGTSVIGAPGTMPFSPQQASENAHYLPQYLRAAAADQDGHVKAASSIADTIIKGLQDRSPTGLPSVDNLALVQQINERFPNTELSKKVTEIGQSLAGYGIARDALAGSESQGATLLREAHAKAASGDLVWQAVSREADAFYKAGVARMEADPQAEGASRGWHVPVAPMDFSSVASIVKGVTDRAHAATSREAHAQTPQSIVTPTELPELQQALGSGPPERVSAFIGALVTQDKGLITTTLRDRKVVSMLTALANTEDAGRYKAVMSGLSQLKATNQTQFADAFGQDLYAKLQAYEVDSWATPDDVLQKRLSARSDGYSDDERKRLRSQADNEVSEITPRDVANLLKGNSDSPMMLMGDRSPPDPDASNVMMGDYRAMFREAYVAARGDVKAAKTMAAERLGTVWKYSDINNGTFMKFAPEKYLVDDKGKPLTVGGSFDWVKEQIQTDLKGLVKPAPHSAIDDYAPGDTAPIEFRLVPTAGTQTAAAAGKAPPYRIAYKEPTTGVWNDNGKFFVPDVAKAQADEEARLRGVTSSHAIDRAKTAGSAPMDMAVQLGIAPPVGTVPVR